MTDEGISLPGTQDYVRPLLVQWYRCGMALRGRGWRRCTAPAECKAGGCVRQRPDIIGVRLSGAAANGE
jgi:hypothetical protein